MKQYVKLFEAYKEESHFLKSADEVQKWLVENTERLQMEGVYIHTNDFSISVNDLAPSENDEDSEENDVKMAVGYYDNPVIIKNKTLERLPVKFVSVENQFYIQNMPNLVSLVGCPLRIEYGDFNCDGCVSLQSLEGCPIELENGDVHCENCDLQTLIYLPENEYSSDGYATVYYEGNPCEAVYDEYGITDEAHARAFGEWIRKDPTEANEFLERLKHNQPETYAMLTSKQGRLWMGIEDEQLQKTYDKVTDIEKGYF